MDYSVWLSRELQKRYDDGKSQAGLAAHLGVHRSITNKMVLGKRWIKADELPKIAAYLGCTIPGTSSESATVDCSGRIVRSTYEGSMPASSVRIAPALDSVHPVKDQIGFEVVDLPHVTHVVAVESAMQRPGDLLVVRRHKAGHASLTLAKLDGGRLVSVYPDVGEISGEVIAVVIETRNRL